MLGLRLYIAYTHMNECDFDGIGVLCVCVLAIIAYIQLRLKHTHNKHHTTVTRIVCMVSVHRMYWMWSRAQRRDSVY